jgi:hypothetical protein
MKKLTLSELENQKSWKEAVIVFTEDSYSKNYSETERSYKVSRDCKYFNPMMIGTSLFGDCLDDKDNGVRLDRYMSLLPTEGKRWEVDYCYITK